jgi:ribonucleoside-diphosphate reductase alpha chain
MSDHIPEPRRRHLPETRRSENHQFNIAGHEGRVTVGFFDDGTPGEIFIAMANEGSTIAGLLDVIAVQTSLLLQYGVPLEVIVRKMGAVKFPPAGHTNSTAIPQASSIIDYVFRWLRLECCTGIARSPH